VENGLCAIKLQIRGESFLHPKLFDCIRYAKDAGVMDVQVTTNGTLLDEKCIHKVFDSGLDRIVFSVDAHHSENYKQRYSTQKYSSVEYNVKRFLELRTELGISRPWVRLQASIPQTDAFHVKQTRLYIEGKFPEADMVGVNRIYDFCDDIDSFPDLHKNYKMLPCSYLMQRLSVFWNGDVTTCCMDYNNHFKLGNVEYQTIQEIWLSEKMYQFRKTHFSGQRKTMSICKYCHNSTILLSDKNVLDNTPGHIAEYT
jgi:radical SAM protein with 4Fe4S-binding SPASM domain